MIRACLLLLSLGLLAACGGGASDTPDAPLTGRFVDAPVAGLAYRTATLSGRTDAEGRFRYRSGETVRFAIGGLDLGAARGAAVITPVQLVAEGRPDHPEVLERVRLLLALDEDGDPDNGIQIPEAAHDGLPDLDFTQDLDGQAGLTDFLATLPHAPTLTDAATAGAHLGSSLLALYAGDYSGTFGGGQSGTWFVTIDTDGRLGGQGQSDQTGPFTITGETSPDGSTTFTGQAGLATFQGTVDFSGNLSGTWVLQSTAQRGTFSGNRITTAPPDPIEPGQPGERLTLAGPDAAALGGRSTVLEGQGLGDIVTLSTPATPSSFPFRNDFLIFVIDATRQSVLTASYGTTQIQGNGAVANRVYALDCTGEQGPRPAACDRIYVDLATNRITFAAAPLLPDPDASDNAATAPLTLTGTLEWATP